MRFNPPPNWPVAADWTPEPGWTPDPTWPPAPAGWQFWIDDSAPAPAAQPQTGPQQMAPPAYQGAPQWQPPVSVRGPIAPPSHTTRNVLIGVGVGAVLVIALVVALVVGFGGDSSKPKSDEDQIRATLSAVQNAWNSDDFDTVVSHGCDSTSDSEADFRRQRQQIGDITIQIKQIHVTGDTAKVDASVKSTKKGSKSSTFDLKKKDGDWKVC
jgi:ketosteroid isomerase-like protein